MRKRGLAERERKEEGVVLSKSLCSPLGAQSAVGLLHCRELIVSLARYFPFLPSEKMGELLGMRKRTEEGKSGKNQVAMCLQALTACYSAPLGWIQKEVAKGSLIHQLVSHRVTVVVGGSVITPLSSFLPSFVSYRPS